MRLVPWLVPIFLLGELKNVSGANEVPTRDVHAVADPCRSRTFTPSTLSIVLRVAFIRCREGFIILAVLRQG